MAEESEEQKEPEQTSNSKIKDAIKKHSKNYWAIAAVVLGVLLLLLLFSKTIGFSITGSAIGLNQAGEKIAESAQAQGVNAEVLKVNDKGSLYEVLLSIEDQQVPIYITKDGEYMVQGIMPLTAETPQAPAQQTQPTEIQKSDKPVVEMFIMTHCPYGTQAEKGIIPVLELLGDKIDGEIKFVHYFMHQPEETETPTQVCIREEQSDKYLDYLKCFLEDGDSERCLTKAKIDKTKLETCKTNNADSYYEADSELSQQYEVRGSPTLVINGVQASSGRDPASYLSIICSAFITAPEECSEELSTTTPSPMWGWEEEGADTTAQC